MILKIRSTSYDLKSRSLVMGVLNITPDSFSDGGRFSSCERAVQHALQMISDGADIIDVGGESTRPGSKFVSTDEELDRVIPVIEAIRNEADIPISIDTNKAKVFQEAVSVGADMLNDITGLTGDPDMLNVLKVNKLPAIIMHSKGNPDVMQNNPEYQDIVLEISSFFKEQAKKAEQAGSSQIILDPGIGFGKTAYHNLLLIKNLGEFKKLGYPILLGPSRKSFIGAALDLDIDQRLEATLASSAIAVVNGADILRLHDVGAGRRAVDMAKLISNA